MSNNKILLIGALFTLGVLAFLFWPKSGNKFNVVPEGKIEVVMYKNPDCGCCTEWAKHMNRAEFHVIEENTQARSEEHTSELQSRPHLVCRLLLEKKKPSRTATSGRGSGSVRPTRRPSTSPATCTAAAR